MADREVIIPPGMEAYYERMHFAPAVRDRDRLYCSGQLGTGADGKLSDDPEAQFAQAFENVKAVLAAAGADFGDVLEMTTYHVDLQTHIRAFMAAKDRSIQEPYPAWTAIGITELAMPGALVEIRVIARAPSA
jgi:enamine deaminase RidA (YjgF/YER057c/UK114 family)